MSILGLVTAIVMLLLVLGFTVAPFLMRQVNNADTFRNKQRERALAYYERVLRNIRDLDDDLATGKIMQTEYDLERERWMGRGVELLKMLEQLDQDQNIDSHLADNAHDADIDAAIESVIAENPEPMQANEVN